MNLKNGGSREVSRELTFAATRFMGREKQVLSFRRLRFLHHAQTIAITGRSYRLKDHATIAGKEDKNKKSKSKSSEPSTAGAAS